ncbi:kinase-like domain-containing protein [Gilbertella persicaria]|uniref:kinase-like domain-containing protein n=1 Tax=Gilbertella persicaria TaxID=101096 RepID=UPI0022212378|nr:kinase-like domain-containing protein [Gilbertella persicaria]KAI8075914.1 kinase-like domain-containing protein [Gilbertella persicaria]
MEFCSLGDLSHYIKQIRSHKSTKGSAGGLPERVVRHFLRQLASALQFLRSQNLIHRDIKPQNLLLTPDKDDLPLLKVADFGFARFLPNASLADTLCGSPLYMGPEILSYKKYDAKADLWSVGAVLYEMVTGRPPFRASNHIELLKKIQENNDQIHFPDERHHDIQIGSDLKDLIRKLLVMNPVSRISFDDFFKHPAVLPEQPIPIHDRPRSLQSTPPSPIQYQRAGSYEPPPFAQMTPRSMSDQPTRRWSMAPFERKQEKKTGKELEDMLQEYVVLDIRSIETNQFADELKATPHSKSPTATHAVNIPNHNRISPSASPFMRERKSSTGSAGSALAKAISKASVRLFGTSMPSPPKDHHHLVGSPHGFMSSHETSSNLKTMKKIERLSCMAHAVAKYGDQKYDALHQKEDVLLAEEAVALYVKSLALLEMGLFIAQQYWHQHMIEVDEEERKNMATPLNDAVQWMRDKFNECLDRAESIKVDATDAICVEKLLYDRALEMSRAAAVHELVGENIAECEQDYQTAIWMLEAILQVRPKGEVTVEADDRRIINKFIDSIRHRITVLRKKLSAATERES